MRNLLASVLLMILGCGPHVTPVAEASAYSAALDVCVETAHNLVEYKTCADKVDTAFGKKP